MILEPAAAPVIRVQQTTVPASAPKDDAVSTGIPEATDLPMATSAVTPPWKRAAAMQARAAANGRMRRVRIQSPCGVGAGRRPLLRCDLLANCASSNFKERRLDSFLAFVETLTASSFRALRPRRPTTNQTPIAHRHTLRAPRRRAYARHTG